MKYKKIKNISTRHLRNNSLNKCNRNELSSSSSKDFNLLKNTSISFSSFDFSNKNAKNILFKNKESQLTSVDRKLLNDLSECTFHPKLERSTNDSKKRNVFYDLFNESKILKEKKNHRLKQYLYNEGKSYSFSPRNNKVYKRSFNKFLDRNEKVKLKSFSMN